MEALGRVIAEAIVHEYGRAQLLRGGPNLVLGDPARYSMALGGKGRAPVSGAARCL